MLRDCPQAFELSKGSGFRAVESDIGAKPGFGLFALEVAESEDFHGVLQD